jgi:TonB family protein
VSVSRACILTLSTAVVLAWSAAAMGQAAPPVLVPLVADDSEIGAYERDAAPPDIGMAAPKRIKNVAPVWPKPINERWRFRVHLVLDPSGKVAESRIVQTLVGDPSARPVGPQGDIVPVMRGTAPARAGLAVLAAVRQWRFEPPARAPMLIVTDIGVDDPPVAASTSKTSMRAPVRIEGNMTPPRKLVDVRPTYPPDAIKARITGIVTIEAVIGPTGDVIDARVVSGVPMLDDAALEAVRQWKFAATQMNGEAVPVIMTVTVNFSLSARN